MTETEAEEEHVVNVILFLRGVFFMVDSTWVQIYKKWILYDTERENWPEMGQVFGLRNDAVYQILKRAQNSKIPD